MFCHVWFYFEKRFKMYHFTKLIIEKQSKNNSFVEK